MAGILLANGPFANDLGEPLLLLLAVMAAWTIAGETLLTLAAGVPSI